LHENDYVPLRHERRVGAISRLWRREYSTKRVADRLESDRMGRRRQARRDRSLRIHDNAAALVQIESDVERKALIDGNERAGKDVQSRRRTGRRAVEGVHGSGIGDRW